MIVLPLPLVGVFLIVMVYTANLGYVIWRSGNKFASIVVLFLAAMIPAILVRLVFFS
jgi:uncharacterized membrane protein